jgi:linoleate 8R-lipoxygenase / 9,12-octadecadienoate 8-hydroperoxide 8R-isomerase
MADCDAHTQALVFTCIFYDADPAKSFPLRQAARALTQQLGQLVELNVQYIARTGAIATILGRLHASNAMTDYGLYMIRRLLESGMPVKDIVWTNILPTAGGMVANQSQLFSQCLDYYLGEGQMHLPAIRKLAQQDTPEAFDKLLHYFLEGGRIKGAVGVYRSVIKPGQLVDNGKTVDLKAGSRVFCNLVGRLGIEPVVTS